MRQAETVREVLQAMSVGFCGAKYDCVVWRRSETHWQVGQNAASNSYTIDDAVKFICSVNGFIYDQTLDFRR